MSDRLSKAVAALFVVGLIAAAVSLRVRQHNNREAIAAESRAIAPQIEADRALRRQDEARAAQREAEARAAREALEARPEIASRRAQAAAVSLETRMRSSLDGELLDVLVLRDDRCSAVLYLVRMVNERTLDPSVLRRAGIRSVRCEGPLGACSMIDVTASDSPVPRPCR